MNQPSPHQQASILLVDDEPDVALTLTDLLESEGHSIDVASTGRLAIEWASARPYDAVVLDIRLPDMDGLLVLEDLAKSHPSLPIIILTGLPDLDAVVGPLEKQGAFAHLQKPIDRTQVRHTIRQALRAKHLTHKMERAHHALMENAIRFQTVFQTATDAIVLADHTGRVMAWNKAAAEMFGYGEEEIFGKPLTLLMPERYREAHTNGLERLQAKGESRVLGKTLILHGLRKNGEEFPIELSLNSWASSGSYPSYSGFIRDLSALQRQEISS